MGVDPSYLSATLRDVTTSYKHLLFRTILNEGIKAEKRFLNFTELAVGMMEEAWWPGFHYRLNFGSADQVVSLITSAFDSDALRSNPKQIRVAFKAKVSVSDKNDLPLRYALSRFIRPWFTEEVSGFSDGRVDRQLIALSKSKYESKKPLYAIEDKGVALQPNWFDYLKCNLTVVQGWSDYQWVRFLEQRNPMVPGLVQKISPPLKRVPLIAQRAIWKNVIKKEQIRCIYTGKILSHNSFALDHFAPRSFVVHDRFWNLTPVEKRLNSEKGDSLPSLDVVPALARQHSLLARTVSECLGREQKNWQRFLDEFAADLNVTEGTLRDPKSLEVVYQSVFSGLLGVAARLGFPDGWRPIGESDVPQVI